MTPKLSFGPVPVLSAVIMLASGFILTFLAGLVRSRRKMRLLQNQGLVITDSHEFIPSSGGASNMLILPSICLHSIFYPVIY